MRESKSESIDEWCDDSGGLNKWSDFFEGMIRSAI